MVNRKRSDSLPTGPPAAAATAIDCGEIILPITLPERLAPTVTTGLTPIETAVADCNLQNNALEEVSEPVMNTPSQPRIGAKKGKRTPVADPEKRTAAPRRPPIAGRDEPACGKP